MSMQASGAEMPRMRQLGQASGIVREPEGGMEVNRMSNLIGSPCQMQSEQQHGAL